jgi:tRNA (guanosine-2'-O-)-methyltransferase
MTPERKDRIQQVLCKRQSDLTVMTARVVKERNLAAIVRTCDAVGVQTLHSVVPEGEEYREYRGTSASANKYVDVLQYPNEHAVVDTLKSAGHQLVAAHFTDEAVDYRDIDYTRPTALIMGAEIEGVSQHIVDQCDACIVIPMMGMVESFNVSVACAIILSEAQRQRQLKGMYEHQSLTEDDYERLLFKWGYPKVAAYCESAGLPYPKLDENGDLLPTSAIQE